jgi:signal transduction histidine kinase
VGRDLREPLDRIDRGVKRCDRIITELLDFARAKGLQPEPTHLDTWLSNVLEEQQIPEGVTVNRDFCAGAAGVCFDREELRRAIINLVDNACQAMVDGNGENGATVGGALTVASRRNGERVEIEIMDTGPGIPEDVLPQVLEPLFSTKPFGTGLGLPTVQRIMEENDGGLEISSEEGRGTQIVVWVPLRDGEEELRR